MSSKNRNCPPQQRLWEPVGVGDQDNLLSSANVWFESSNGHGFICVFLSKIHIWYVQIVFLSKYVTYCFINLHVCIYCACTSETPSCYIYLSYNIRFAYCILVIYLSLLVYLCKCSTLLLIVEFYLRYPLTHLVFVRNHRQTCITSKQCSWCSELWSESWPNVTTAPCGQVCQFNYLLAWFLQPMIADSVG